MLHEDAELSKYPPFFQFIDNLAQDGPPNNKLVVLPQALTNASNIPSHLFSHKGPHSKYALKVGCLMQFLFLSDPNHYFRELCGLFSGPDEVCSFFRVLFDCHPPAHETSKAIAVAFGRIANWTELVVALQLYKCFTGKNLVGTDLGKVAVFEPSPMTQHPPTEELFDLLADATASTEECGRCVAQLMRITAHLPRKQWCSLWGLVCEKHCDDEHLWHSVYSSMHQLQKSSLLVPSSKWMT